jgi:hypothetical protein
LDGWTKDQQSHKNYSRGERRKRWKMEVTREDMKDFLTWLDTTGDDFAEEVVKSDVE